VEQLLLSHQHSSSSSSSHTKQRVTARVLELVLAFDGPHFSSWCQHSAKDAKRSAGIVKNAIHSSTGTGPGQSIVVDTLSCEEGHYLDFNVLQTIAVDCILVHNNNNNNITPAAPTATVNATAHSSSPPSSPLYLPALSPVHMLSLLSFLSYVAERTSNGASGGSGNNSGCGVHQQQLPPHMIKFDAGKGVGPVICYIPERERERERELTYLSV
jgi:hypothetical protein